MSAWYAGGCVLSGNYMVFFLMIIFFDLVIEFFLSIMMVSALGLIMSFPATNLIIPSNLAGKTSSYVALPR